MRAPVAPYRCPSQLALITRSPENPRISRNGPPGRDHNEVGSHRVVPHSRGAPVPDQRCRTNIGPLRRVELQAGVYQEFRGRLGSNARSGRSTVRGRHTAARVEHEASHATVINTTRRSIPVQRPLTAPTRRTPRSQRIGESFTGAPHYAV
jgi:hypothetical protein